VNILNRLCLGLGVGPPIRVAIFLMCLVSSSFSADNSFKDNYLPWASRIITLTGVDASGTVTATNLQINGSGTFTNDVQINDDLNVSSEGTFASIVVTGLTEGTIDNVVIGGSTAKAGTFTTLIGTAGTINGSTIGGTSAGAGTFTNLTANGTFTATGGTIDGIPIGATTSSAARFLYLTSAGMTLTSTIQGGADAALGDLTLTGDIVTAVGANFSGNITVVDVSSTGNISGSSSAFTTAVFTEVPNGFMVDGTVTATSFSGDGSGITNLSAGTQIVDGDAHATASDGVSIIFDVDGGGNEMTILTTSVGIGTPTPSKELTVNGEITASSEISSSTTVSGTTLTASILITAPQGTFTNISGNGTGIGGVVHTATNETINGTKTFSDIDVDGGYIDGTPIGQTSASNAKFGIVTATTANLTTINATTINGTINTPAQNTITSVGTLASVDIDGGAIDGTPIGQSSASNAIFGVVTATTGNITTLNSTTINGEIGTAAQPNITSIGSLSRVTATDFDGTNFNGTNLTGTLQTAAQPNITSIGSANRLTATDFDGTNFNGTNLTGTLQTAAQPNITSIGSASRLTATDFDGTNGNFTNVAGTLTTANQPNVTDIGTQTTADIDGGFIDGTPIGQTSPSDSKFGTTTATTGNFTTANITNGTITGDLTDQGKIFVGASTNRNTNLYDSHIWVEDNFTPYLSGLAQILSNGAGARGYFGGGVRGTGNVYMSIGGYDSSNASFTETDPGVVNAFRLRLIRSSDSVGELHFEKFDASGNDIDTTYFRITQSVASFSLPIIAGNITSNGTINGQGAVMVNGASLPPPSYGGLYIADDSLTQVTVSTAGHYTTTTTWELSAEKTGYLTDSQGNTDFSTYPSDGFVVDTDGAGTYLFNIEVTASGTNNANVKFYPHIDGVIMAGCGIKMVMDSAGKAERGAVSCLQALSVGEFVDMRITADGAGNTVAISPGNFTLTRVDN